MLKKEVLRRDKDFSAIYRKGKNVPDKYVVVIFRKNGLSYNRTAFLASKKVGNSVQRNRAKRLLKESYRFQKEYLKQGYDIIFISRNRINGRGFEEVNRSMINALQRSGLIKSREVEQ